jgi:hypothetical protein
VFAKDSIIIAILQYAAHQDAKKGFSEPDFAPFDLQQLGKMPPEVRPAFTAARPNDKQALRQREGGHA